MALNLDAYEVLIFALSTENAGLRAQLAEVQDQCVELAVDAGELHAELMLLRRDLADARADRDGWRAAAERYRSTG